MKAESEWSGELTGLEARAETDCLDDLHHRRRDLIRRNAKLIALYGNFGHYDDHRKRMVEAMKVKARMELQEQNIKTTEAMIDAHAYGS